MRKEKDMPIFVCENCGTVSRARVTSCVRCGKDTVIELPESSFMAIEKEAIRCFTEGQFYRMDNLRRIEPYFFKANNFVPGFSVRCGEYEGRIFAINREKTRYYCSPTYENQNFVIRECSQIKKVEIKETATWDSSFGGGLVYGYTEAMLSSILPRKTVKIKLLTSDAKEPEVNIEILSAPEIKDSELYTYCHETAEAICKELKKITGDSAAEGGGDLVGKLKELSELRRQGFLTEEEFAQAKKKILNL